MADPSDRNGYYGRQIGNSNAATAKPAYFYYAPTLEQQGQRPRQQEQSNEREQFQQSRGGGGQFGLDGGVRGQTMQASRMTPSPSPKKSPKVVHKSMDPRQMTTTTNRMNGMGEFHQEPDGTIVMVQPTPVDPYENRVKCVKFVIFGANVILLIVGVSLLSFGAWLKIDDRFRDLLSENFRQVTSKEIDPILYIGTYIIIGAALGMIMVSFIGCCGSILHNKCLLCVYFVFLMALFFLEVSIIVLVLVKREKIENDVGEALDYMVQHYYQGPGIVTDVMDMLQTTFKCCGNSGCGDYADFLRQNVPRSCDIQCDGCRYRMFRFFRDGFIVIGVAMLFVFIAELLAISFSIYLFCFMQTHSKARRRYVYYKPAEPSTRITPTDHQSTAPIQVRTLGKKPL